MRDASNTARGQRGGFTLTELLVVMTIIGILIGFILVAAQDGIRRAQERATQELIAKLESGVAERLEAVLLRRGDISLGHQALAAISNANFPAVNNVSDPNFLLIQALVSAGYLSTNQVVLSPQRAQAIAQFDIVRANMPDVFFIQGGQIATQYPLSFAGLDYPLGSGNFLVPLGAISGGAPGMPMTVSGATGGDPNQAIGIFGASFQAAGGIYKNLGYLPQGYDGADNSNPPNGLVDELAEGVGGDPLVADPDTPTSQIHLSALIARRLALHKHVTARSEMLYALLVEGGGPMGSVFNGDDFTNREVQDTDGDGLPEFIDAWGQPLQFYRWPIYYNNLSSTTLTPTQQIGYVQKGADLYNGPWNGQAMEPRQLDPLDPNQTLTAPAWWSSGVNSANPTGQAYSGSAGQFMSYFHTLYDPNASSVSAAQTSGGALWDRSGAYPRRAFHSRFLILSGGPDETPGTARLFSANESPGSLGTLFGVSDNSGQAVALNTGNIVLIENQAAAVDPSARGAPLATQVPAAANQTTQALLTAGGDDITNQGMAAPGVGVR